MIDLREYRKRVQESISELKRDIEVLQSGQITLRSKDGDGPWVDATPEAIARDKRVLGTYEMILADIERRMAEGR